MKAQKLSRKLYAALAPEHVLLVVCVCQLAASASLLFPVDSNMIFCVFSVAQVKEAQQHTGATQRFIEEKLSGHARRLISYMEEMVATSEYEAECKVEALQSKLVAAYEQLEKLQGNIETSGTRSRKLSRWR